MAVKPVIELISKIFGKNALSKTIGTRTNVITLPDADVKRVIKNELDISKASDAQLEVFKDRVEKLIPDIPKMNDQELLTLKGNLQRYYDRMYPPKAEVFDFQTRGKMPKEGIEQLEAKRGLPEDVDPNSPLGRIMQRVQKVEAEGKSLAEEFNMEGQLEKGIQDLMQTQSSAIKMQDEGLVRATVREIMDRDIKSGKLKIPKEEMDVITEYSSVNDPIDIWRKYYGEDALEQLDSMVPDFYQMRTSSEAADAATKKFNFEPKLDRPVGSFDPDKPPEFADGGRVELAFGGAIDRGVKMGVLGLATSNPDNKNIIGYSPEIKQLSPVSKPTLSEVSQVNRFANQYIQNTTGEFIDENKNGIDDRLEKFADGGRVNLSKGTSLKYMIDFILQNAKKVTKKVPSKQFLEKMAEMNPQNIVNAYEDVKKRAGIIDDPDVLMGQAPKTDLKKIRGKAKKDKEGIQQLADDNQIPVRDNTLKADQILEVPEPFKSKYKDEFLAHDQIFGRRSGDNKVDAELIAEQVAEMKGLDYDDLGYTEKMNLYDKAYGYLSLLDRTKGAMKEAKGRTLQANGGVAYLMGL